MKTIRNLKETIRDEKPHSAWAYGVKQYALELLEELPEDYEFYGSPADRKTLLNGAGSWAQYSEGGCSLIYDTAIADRTSTKTELRITRNGERQPNLRENWIDVQSRALYQAERMILRLSN